MHYLPHSLTPSLSLSLCPPPTPISFSACQIIYISLSVFLKAKTQCTREHGQAVRGTKKTQTNDSLVVCLRGQCKSDESVAAMASRDCDDLRDRPRWRHANSLDRSKQKQEDFLRALMVLWPPLVNICVSFQHHTFIWAPLEHAQMGQALWKWAGRREWEVEYKCRSIMRGILKGWSRITTRATKQWTLSVFNNIQIGSNYGIKQHPLDKRWSCRLISHFAFIEVGRRLLESGQETYAKAHHTSL